MLQIYVSKYISRFDCAVVYNSTRKATFLYPFSADYSPYSSYCYNTQCDENRMKEAWAFKQKEVVQLYYYLQERILANTYKSMCFILLSFVIDYKSYETCFSLNEIYEFANWNKQQIIVSHR